MRIRDALITALTLITHAGFAQFVYSTGTGSSGQPNGLINQYAYDGSFIKSFGYVTSDAGLAAGLDGQVFSVNGTRINKYDSAGQLLMTFGSSYGAGPIAFGGGYVYSIGTREDRGQSPNGLINQYLSDGTFVKAFGSTAANAGLAVGPDGSVYAVDNRTGTSLNRYDPSSGSLLTSFGKAYGAGPIAVGPDGKVYTASIYDSGQPNYMINEYAADGTLIKTFGSIISDGGLTVGSDGSIYSVNGIGVSGINKYSSSGIFMFSFGQAYSAGHIAATASIPEPSSFSLLALGVVVVTLRRRR
jgi:hypothetical protein